jgi:hypothetical protein
MGAVLAHMGAICNCAGAVCAIWKPRDAIWNWVGAMRLALELGKHGYIRFYNRALSKTFGSTVAKERRCGACRRFVSKMACQGERTVESP